MGKLRKAYMPRWVAVFVAVVTVPMWLWLTYRTFASGEMPAGEWGIMSLVFGAVVVVVWLMASRRLPAYLIEEDDEA